MKKILCCLVLLLCGCTAAFAIFDSYTIDRDKLPEEAQNFLREHFGNARVSMIKVDKHLLRKTDYDVRMVNGTKIEFNNSGRWTSVDCGTRTVPEGIVPSTIRRYIRRNYADVSIVSIWRKSPGYHVGLSDGVILKFTLLGQFKGVKMEE